MTISAGWLSRSYIANINSGIITPIITSTAPVSPMVPRVNRYVGKPIVTAVPKQTNWRGLMLRAIRLFIRFRSLGILTKAIISGKQE